MTPRQRKPASVMSPILIACLFLLITYPSFSRIRVVDGPRFRYERIERLRL